MFKKQISYLSPKVRTVEIAQRQVICQSGGIKNMEVDEDDGGDEFELY